MKHEKIKLTVLLLSMCIIAQAQQASTASGGDASGSGGTAAYSIGQVVYTTNTDALGSVSQGVQQAYEIYTVGIEEAGMNISLSVFPNPTADNLTLQISDYNNENLSYQLIDMQGKLLINGQVTEQQTQINTANLSAGIYFINVLNQENLSAKRHGELFHSFKIIKH